MSIIRLSDAVSVSTIVRALASVIVPSTSTSCVNSIAHISSILYPATLQERLFSLSRLPLHTGQGFSLTRYMSRFTDASFKFEVSRLMSIRCR